MNGSVTSIPIPLRVGGSLCLDFTNTAAYRNSDRQQEYLQNYAYLIAWCWRENLVSHEGVAHYQQIATARPAAGKAALETALNLREALFRIFCAYIDGETPPAEDIRTFQAVLGNALSHRQLALDSGKPSWSWNTSPDDMTSMLYPVALAAGELLASDQLPRVKRCPGCGWLFLDTSRNGMRRWCRMENCGSEAKSQRQYERKRAAKLQPGRRVVQDMHDV
jgi:predicted RNA-binding Zn ribbon-like protein